MPEAYAHGLEQAVFAPFAAALAQRVAARRPRRVLELAAGTGALTRDLVAAGLDVVATDLNPAMVAFGAAAVPGPRWEQADAQDLHHADGAFDLVCCAFGVMFFPDRRAAYAQVARVLAPGGRFLFSTWDTLGTHGFARPLAHGLEAALPGGPPAFLTRIPHGYADPAMIEADLRAVGFVEVRCDTVELTGHADSAAQVAGGFCRGTPLRAALAEQPDPAAVAAEVAAVMTAELGEGPVAATMAAHLVEVLRR
jgi:SAM-dependent methyltransferase